jgi:hypothetical protein
MLFNTSAPTQGVASLGPAGVGQASDQLEGGGLLGLTAIAKARDIGRAPVDQALG